MHAPLQIKHGFKGSCVLQFSNATNSWQTLTWMVRGTHLLNFTLLLSLARGSSAKPNEQPFSTSRSNCSHYRVSLRQWHICRCTRCYPQYWLVGCLHFEEVCIDRIGLVTFECVWIIEVYILFQRCQQGGVPLCTVLNWGDRWQHTLQSNTL